jgi:uncharacterized protein YidB (DUF937 family)
MGLLDSLLSMAAGAPKSTAANHNAVTSIMDILNSNQVGGIDGMVEKMSKAGLGKTMDSWISTGSNKSIKGKQISNVLGSDIVAQLAGKLGINQAQASAMLARFMPLIIDKLTPDGKKSSAGQIKVTDIIGMILK